MAAWDKDLDEVAPTRRAAWERDLDQPTARPITAPSAADRARYSPTAGMGTFERLAAGAGKGMYDLARGIGQRVGLVSQADIDEARRLDAPLMETTAGTVGNVAGKVATALPTMLIPGANTLAGAALVGGAQGLLEPTAADESVLGNVALGAGLGAGGVIAGRGAKAVGQGIRGIAEPFTRAGRERITGRVLTEFAADPAAAAAAARASPAVTATGARPMTDEATRDIGLAQLRRAMVSADPQVASDVAAREMANNAARVGILQDLAGDAGKRELFTGARGAAAQELYGKAFGTKIDPQTLSPSIKGEITKLMGRPSIQDAMAAARELASEEGVRIGKDAAGSVQGLHYMKMALDDMIEGAGAKGLGSQRKRALVGSRDKLVNLIENLAPDYREARATYSAMSRPINQMDIGERLMKTATTARTDLAGNPIAQTAALARQLRDEDALLRQSGLRGQSSLDEVLDPEQAAGLRAVLSEMNTRTALQDAGKVTGSPTAQYLAAQNVLRRTLGPTGMPASWSEGIMQSGVGDALSSLLGGAYRVTGAAPRLQTRIAESLLDPAVAAPLLERGIAAQAPALQSSIARQLLNTAAARTPAAIAFGQD